MKYITIFTYYFGALIISIILIMGAYKLGELLIDSRLLNKEGKETIAIVEEVWRGKCGSGYGYFATYKFEVNGKEYQSISSCIAPEDSKKGDRHYILYLEDDPMHNRILFDRMVE